MGIVDRILGKDSPKAKTLAETRKALESARHAAQIAHGAVLELDAAHAATEDEDAVMRILAKKDIAARKHAIASTALALAEDEHAAADLAERKRLAAVQKDKADQVSAQLGKLIEQAIELDRQAYALNEAFLAHVNAFGSAIAEANRLGGEAGERDDYTPTGEFELRQLVRGRVRDARIVEGRRQTSDNFPSPPNVANLLHLDQLG
jgi:hypothetical protein